MSSNPTVSHPVDNNIHGKETQHLVVETVGGRWFIVSSLFNKKDTIVITIERYTGRLLFTGQSGVDIFPSPKDALERISMGKRILKNVIKCHALIGYYITGTAGNLVVVSKVSVDLVLPPEHKVQTIVEASTISIALGYPFQLTKTELSNAQALCDFPINNLHFYCETLDLTRPFPSTHNILDYSREFCWNDFLMREFKRIGLEECCCVLLQGLATGKQVVAKDEKGVSVCLVTKRSCLNPGTRYLARGLNSLNSPGNEYEYEFLVWREKDCLVNWSSHFGRRGTVPIRWRSEINSQFADAVIVIDDDPFRGVLEYYQRLANAYEKMPILIVNLLRSKTIHNDEGKLTDYYVDSLKVVKKNNFQVSMLHFDWLDAEKSNGIGVAVDMLSDLMQETLKELSMNVGTFRISREGKLLDSKIAQKQQGIFRFNCADSLDRTNLVVFYLSLLQLPDLLHAIGVDSLTRVDNKPTLENMKNNYNEFLLLKVAEMFIQNGDVCSTLSTNTVAMHTSHIREFAQHLPLAPNNTKIIVERRIQNTLFDKARNASYEMFLGMNWDIYFPSIKQPNFRYVTPYPSFIFKGIPCMYSMNEEVTLLKTTTKYAWVCPKDYDFVEINLFLPFYCRVTELALTVRHGLNDLSSPLRMDVFVGRYLDKCAVAFQGLIIPRCDDNTKLLYSLAAVGGTNNLAPEGTLYDYYGKLDASDMRIVRIILNGISAGANMTMGSIQLFGIEDDIHSFYGDDGVSSSSTPKQLTTNQNKPNISYINATSTNNNNNNTNVVNQTQPPPILTKEGLLLDFSGGDTKKDTDFLLDFEQFHINTTTTKSSDVKTNNDNSMFSKSPSQKSPLLDNVDNTNKSPSDKSPIAEEKVKDVDFFGFNVSYQTLPTETTIATTTTTVPNNNVDPIVGSPSKGTVNSEQSKKLEIPLSPRTATNTTVITEKGNVDASDYLKKVLALKSARPSFTDAIELDYIRLKAKMSRQDRDEILVGQGYNISNFDPNHFVYKRDEKIENTIRAKYKRSTCHQCNASITLRYYSCRYCSFTFCPKCTAKDKFPILEFQWNSPQVVCQKCFDILGKQLSLLKEIKKMIALENHNEKSDRGISDWLPKNVPIVYEKVVCMNQFPGISILSSVETDPNSPPIESILFNNNNNNSKYWFAPEKVKMVNIIIVLPCMIKITKILMIVDALGYKQEEIPECQVMTSERLKFDDRVGWKWKEEIGGGDILPDEKIQLTSLRSKCRMIQVQLKKTTKFLHLGRLLIYGEIIPPIDTNIKMTRNENNHYEASLLQKPKITRVPLKVEPKPVDNNALEINLPEASYVSGFQVTVKHGDDGIPTQMRDIRVTLLSDSSQIVLMHMVPKVPMGTTLSYDFEKTYDGIKSVKLEFMSNYSGATIAVGRIILYYNQLIV